MMWSADASVTTLRQIVANAVTAEVVISIENPRSSVAATRERARVASNLDEAAWTASAPAAIQQQAMAVSMKRKKPIHGRISHRSPEGMIVRPMTRALGFRSVVMNMPLTDTDDVPRADVGRRQSLMARKAIQAAAANFSAAAATGWLSKRRGLRPSPRE